MVHRGIHAGRLLVLGLAISFLLASSFTLVGTPRGPSSSGTAALHAFLRPPSQGTTQVKSNNWAGYGVGSGTGGVTDVQGSWRVPQIAAVCPSSTRGSSFWVGMDGTTATLEAIGTSTECHSGSAVYSAWYELSPAFVRLSMAVHHSDNMHGEVKYSVSTKLFTLTLKDVTSGHSFSISKSLSAASRASAEWIASDEGTGVGSATYPLTDFGWVTFANTSATIGGHTHSIGGFPNDAFTMWNQGGTKIKASVGALSSGGSQFRVTWKSAGP